MINGLTPFLIMNNKKKIADFPQLPPSLEIAAKCVALDKVEVVPGTREVGSHAYNPELRVLRIGNWKKRLINKSVNHLTERINQFCDISTEKPVFIPYILGNFKEEGIWVYNDMQYDIIPT